MLAAQNIELVFLFNFQRMDIEIKYSNMYMYKIIKIES